MTDVRSYSLAAEGDRQAAPHFKVREFACKDGSDPVFVSPRLAGVLEAIRTHFGAPVTITSGYRTPAHNAATRGSSPRSQHLYGLAADIQVEGAAPRRRGRLCGDPAARRRGHRDLWHLHPHRCAASKEPLAGVRPWRPSGPPCSRAGSPWRGC